MLLLLAPSPPPFYSWLTVWSLGNGLIFDDDLTRRKIRLIESNANPLYKKSTRARICKRLWSPGIDSEESTPPTYVA